MRKSSSNRTSSTNVFKRRVKKGLNYRVQCFAGTSGVCLIVLVLFQLYCFVYLSSKNPTKLRVDNTTPTETSKEEENTNISISNVPKIATSPKSGRRFLAMVTTSMDSEARRAKFYPAWKQVWPELTIVPEYSFLNHPKLQGYALLTANVLGMHKALEFSKSTHEEFDYFIFLEDDAFPFENTTWPTANHSTSNDLDRMLDELETNKGGALFLGSHAVYSFDRKRLVENDGNINTSIAALLHGYGTYAWIISRQYMPQLKEHYSHVIQNKINKKGATDTEAHYFFQSQDIGEYVAVPLMVDHRSHGDSLTWNTKQSHSWIDTVKSWFCPTRSWEGNRQWWTFQEVVSRPKGHYSAMNTYGDLVYTKVEILKFVILILFLLGLCHTYYYYSIGSTTYLLQFGSRLKSK